MPINILGMIGVAPPTGGATVHVIGGGIDREYVCRFAQVHEAAGFDAVLVGYSSSSAEGFQIAQYAAAHTDQLKFLVAHRPGFVMPTLAAGRPPRSITSPTVGCGCTLSPVAPTESSAVMAIGWA